MSIGVLSIEPDFAPAVLSAARVGVWQRDPVRGVIRCNATMCDLYGIGRAEGRRGVPLSRLRDAILSPDRIILDGRDALARERGGLMMTEYRVRARDGAVRWIMVRGHYEPLRPGWVMPGGRGIVIDITEGRASDLGDEGAAVLTLERSDLPDDALRPLHRAVDHAIAAHAEIKGTPGAAELVSASSILLHLLGRRLAAERGTLVSID